MKQTIIYRGEKLGEQVSWWARVLVSKWLGEQVTWWARLIQDG